MNGNPTNRRRKKLVRIDLQLKVVFIILFVTSMVLLINFQLALVGLTSLGGQYADSSQARAVVDAVRQTLIYKFLISVGLAVPIAASLGILYSFKFCGPIYRFKKYFTDMVNGRWDERCFLRKDDDLKDVASSINAGCDMLRNHIHSSHGILQEVKDFLRASDQQVADGERKELLKGLLARIEEEEDTYAVRLAKPAPTQGESDDGSDSPISASSSASGSEATDPADTSSTGTGSAGSETPELERQS